MWAGGFPRAAISPAKSTNKRRQIALSSEALERLTAAGATIADVTVPRAAMIPLTYSRIVLPEAFAVHAKMLAENLDAYTSDVGRRLSSGGDISREEYEQAQADRAVFRRTREADGRWGNDRRRDCSPSGDDTAHLLANRASRSVRSAREDACRESRRVHIGCGPAAFLGRRYLPRRVRTSAGRSRCLPAHSRG